MSQYLSVQKKGSVIYLSSQAVSQNHSALSYLHIGSMLPGENMDRVVMIVDEIHPGPSLVKLL